jgi:glycosyltransferase involved in cell wall biosynthesis
MKTLVIIPAYNEEKSVGKVIKAVNKAYPSASVLVVNDCSVDNTPQVAVAAGATVVNLPVNLGIGGAVQTGYKYALKQGYDIAVQLDADGQHDPKDLPTLLLPIINGEADFVLGSRYVQASTYSAPLSRRIGMIIFSTMVSVICRKTFKDTTSGYRAANRSVISFFSRHYPSDYPEVEALVMLRREGFEVSEVPVSMQERAAGKSSITPIKSIYYMIKVTLALLMNVIRPKLGIRDEVHSGG